MNNYSKRDNWELISKTKINFQEEISEINQNDEMY